MKAAAEDVADVAVERQKRTRPKAKANPRRATPATYVVKPDTTSKSAQS